MSEEEEKCQIDEDCLDQGWHVCMQLMSAPTPDWPNLPCRDLFVGGELMSGKTESCVAH